MKLFNVPNGLVFITFVLCFCSCSKGKEDVNDLQSEIDENAKKEAAQNLIVPEGYTDYFTNSPNLSFKKDSIKITFFTTTDWKINKLTDLYGNNWYKISKMSGEKGINTIIVTVDQNSNSLSRFVIIEFETKYNFRSLIIKQKEGKLLNAKMKSFEIPEYGGDYDDYIDHTTNFNYTTTVTENCDWIIITKNNNGYFKFSVSYNETGKERTAAIVFMSDEKDLSDTIKIHQDCEELTDVKNHSAGGLLSAVGGVEKIKSIKKLRISGILNSTDITTIRTMQNLYYLDIENIKLEVGGSEYFNNYKIMVENGNITAGAIFQNVKNLRYVIWSKYLTTVYPFAFYGCESLTSMKLQNNTKIIGGNAFNICVKLKNINMPETLIELGSGCFGSCLNMEKIIIPKYVTQIGEYAFNSCNALKSIYLYANKDKFNKKYYPIFPAAVLKNCTLYILKGTTVNDWYNTQFFDFANINATL